MGNSPTTFLNNEPASLLITIDRIPCRIVSDSTDGSPASPALDATTPRRDEYSAHRRKDDRKQAQSRGE
jgi:hypothetical protein